MIIEEEKVTHPHGFDDALLKLFHLIGDFISPVLLSQHLIGETDIFFIKISDDSPDYADEKNVDQMMMLV